MSMVNMMGQMAIQSMMMQLYQTNPQMYNLAQQAYQRNVNPKDLFAQITYGYTPEQKEELFRQAMQYGIPENVINQFR